MPIRSRDRSRHLTALDGVHLLRAWRRRGDITQVAFCQRHQVSAKTLRHWLRMDHPAQSSARPSFTEIAASSVESRLARVQLTVHSVQIVIALPMERQCLRELFASLSQDASVPC
jgi:hypothetical protein